MKTLYFSPFRSFETARLASDSAIYIYLLINLFMDWSSLIDIYSTVSSLNIGV